MSGRRALAIVLGAVLVGGGLAAGCGGGAKAPAAPAPPPEVTPPSAAEPPAPPAPPPSPRELLSAQVEVVVRGYETVANLASPSVACGAVADALDGAARSTAEARAAVALAARGEQAADVDELLTAAGPRLVPALAAVDAAATRCAAEPRVARALEAFDR